ncbi:MAG: potassium channel family protein [Methylophilaceae bacterium]
MNSILFMILRRLRRPLILIIVSFAIATLGLSLMPGVDDKGEIWHMTIFQAFYVVSFTASTIGFGEVPYPYSQAQRLWMTLSIYLTVIPWFYAVGKIITLLQDVSLRQVVTAERFAKSVRQLQEPFFIICSYGQPASVLAKTLDEKDMRVVIVEQDQERLNELALSDKKNVILSLCADAKLPENLIRAGIDNPYCSAVVTLTDNDDVNLAVAVSVKLMKPNLRVIARAERADIAANMASFRTDHIINPFELFGDQLAMRVHALGTYILHQWLTGIPGDTLPPPENPPRGSWLVCGYGRFGKSVVENLEREHLTTTIIEAMPDLTDCENCVVGSGTEAKTLIEAGIENACGIVAGTDNDINNLSIVMTAKELNPNLFLIIRKNNRSNASLYRKFRADITMQTTDIIAHECLAHMLTPLLAEFLTLVRNQDNQWANNLISQLVDVVGETVPETWAVTINTKKATAVSEYIDSGMIVKLENLMQDPANREKELELVPLLLVRDGNSLLVPDKDTVILNGDRILFCGTYDAKNALPSSLNNSKTFNYIMNGLEVSDSTVWRWITKLVTD